MKNWAGNVTYSSANVLRPRSVEEAQKLIAGNATIRVLGTRHSFSLVGDSGAGGALLSTEHLDRIVAIGDTTVTVEAGIRYGELSRALHDHGLAVANLASLPHISVGGAIATGTHGSGVANRSLAAAVSAVELVGADGSIRRLRRGDDDFDGAVVSLGALGLVAYVTLDVVPAFDLRQYVFEDLSWAALDGRLDEILAGGYSVSLFTLWTERGVDQVWVKTADELDAPYFGAPPARRPRNPVLGAPWENTTEQLGMPGASGERLPHFRLGFTPSGGDELQSEYVVAREHGAEALQAIRGLGPLLTPLLLISEIRTIAADTLWLSPFYGRHSIAFHFTWKPVATDVLAVLPHIESALAPFEPRPHWGKVFLASPSNVEAVYPKLPEFRQLRARMDEGGKFGNDFTARYIDQLGT